MRRRPDTLAPSLAAKCAVAQTEMATCAPGPGIPMANVTDSSRPNDTLHGSVERVTFHSAESGFCVLRVKARGHRDLVTVVGTLPEIRAGEWLEAEGRWVIDPNHGQQLKANVLRTVQPDTVEGMEKYLASGLIKGIGPVFAKKLVKHFREQVFDVIEHQPEQLLHVPGIGPGRQ